MKSLLIALVAIIFSITSSNAQAQKKPSLSITVGDLSEDAGKCGVTTDNLRAPAVLILRQNRIDVASKDTFPYLYINLSNMISGASCVWSLSVSIKTLQPSQDRNGFRANKWEFIELCSSRGGGGIASVNRTSTLITEQIEQQLKACLAEVIY